MASSFTFYAAAPDLIMFQCYGPSHGQIGVHSVSPADVSKNIAALEKMGFINRNARKEYLDYRDWTWKPKS